MQSQEDYSASEPNGTEPVVTTDTSLAAYLHYHGHAFVGLMQDPYDSHRKAYVFVRTAQTEEHELEYQSNEVTLHPKLYYKSIRVMHRMLKDGRIIEK